MTTVASPIAANNFLGTLTEPELQDYFLKSSDEKELIKHLMTAPNSFAYKEAVAFIHQEESDRLV